MEDLDDEGESDDVEVANVDGVVEDRVVVVELTICAVKLLVDPSEGAAKPS